MKRSIHYIPEDSAFPNLGLNVLEPSNQAKANSTPSMKNFNLVKGIPQKRLGYWALGDSFDEPVLGLYEFQTIENTKILLAITNTHQYKLDTSGGSFSWVDISAVDMSDVPIWTGTEENFLDIMIVSGIDGSDEYAKWIVVSNGVDTPLYWDGVASTFLEYTPNITNFEVYKTGRQFFNRVVLSNITTSDAANTQIIGWSAAQELLDFTATGSGEIIVPGVKGEFIRAEKLRDRLAIYAEDSIALMSYVGGQVIFSIENVCDETRLVSPRTVTDLGQYHVFLSQETAFLFDGTALMRTLGDRIYRLYREELAVSRSPESFSFHDSPRQQVYFTVPVGDSDGHAIYVLEYDTYDIGASRWTRHVYHAKPTAMAYWSRVSTLTFDSNWAQATPFNLATFPWNSGTTREGFPVRVVAVEEVADTEWQVYVADETMSSDGSTAVQASWDSQDFTVPQGFLSENMRVIEIEIEARGTSMDVYYSTNQGQGYTFVETVSLNSEWTKYSILVDILATNFRIHLENNEVDGALSFRWYRAHVRPGGPT